MQFCACAVRPHRQPVRGAACDNGIREEAKLLRAYSRTHNMESRGQSTERGGHQPGVMLHSKGVLRMLEKFVYCSVTPCCAMYC